MISRIFAKYEFFVVPLSLFAPDGSLYFAKDKSIIATELGEFQPDENYIEEDANSESRQVIIFDAMSIVNKINKKAESLENCDEFASKFCEIINFQGRGFDEVRIIFDRYNGKPVKSNPRSGQNEGPVPVHYKVADTNRIRHLETKYFLTSLATKKGLLIIFHED